MIPRICQSSDSRHRTLLLSGADCARSRRSARRLRRDRDQRLRNTRFMGSFSRATDRAPIRSSTSSQVRDLDSRLDFISQESQRIQQKKNFRIPARLQNRKCAGAAGPATRAQRAERQRGAPVFNGATATVYPIRAARPCWKKQQQQREKNRLHFSDSLSLERERERDEATRGFARAAGARTAACRRPGGAGAS